MKTSELITFIKSKVPYIYYENRIPKDVKSSCAFVKFTGGFPTRDTGIRQPSFQIWIQGEASSQGWDDAENTANNLFEELTNLEEVIIGNESVVVIRCMNSIPMFLGVSPNDNPIYSLNFSMVVR